MNLNEDALGVITNSLLFSWFDGVADPEEIGEDDIHEDDQDALKEWLASEDGVEAAGHTAGKVLAALEAAGFTLTRDPTVVDGHVRRVEYARAFDNPSPSDGPIPWNREFYGEPDLSKPPPSAARGLPMHWLARTVTTGPWEPVTEAGS